MSDIPKACLEAAEEILSGEPQDEYSAIDIARIIADKTGVGEMVEALEEHHAIREKLIKKINEYCQEPIEHGPDELSEKTQALLTKHKGTTDETT